jgi:integrase
MHELSSQALSPASDRSSYPRTCSRLSSRRGALAASAWDRNQPGGNAVKETGAGDWGNELDLVFTREDGSLVHPQAFSEVFEQHVTESKLPKLSLHGLRHTHATIALRAGVHPKVVSERLGHASVAFTLDVYTDSLPDMQETAANLIAALVLDA